MTRIYLIRHAEAEGNLYRRAQGHFDSNLTALGRSQLRALADRFRDVPLDALWSSDLIRTRSTAAAILKTHPELTLMTSRSLREIDVGVWEDMPWGNIAADYPEEMEYFTRDPARWHVTDCEPYKHLQDRIRTAVLELGARYDGRTVAVVSHGLCIRALLCDLFGVPSPEIGKIPYGDNTAVSLLSVEGDRIRVEWYNDASHLTGEGLSTFSRQAWWRHSDLPARRIYSRFVPMNPAVERALYVRCYSETWKQSHGTLQGFSPEVYLLSAEAHVNRDPRSLQKLYLAEDFAGLVELDPERGALDGTGWISLLYLEPNMRGRRLGVQLIGHGVSVFRRMGRSRMQLHVAKDNEHAIGFYKAVGFRVAGTARGVGGSLYLMEMDISPHIVAPEEI
ncbi:MAG: GNAT family N-acetyltransferase [Oscillospiraceae bacterium]|nr:GNAT family N-acetyltransferase [Oscillospiraceae bacterium]